MKHLNIYLFAALLGLTLFTSCSDDDEPEVLFAPVTIDLEHVWGATQAPFSLGQTVTHPLTGDEMTFSTWKYYLSNVRLQSTDGTWYTVPDSYYLVDLSKDDARVTIEDVPTGNYDAIEFMLGVDAASNTEGVQEGALAPSNDMFWSWNTGYIMLKAEGTSPQSEVGNFAFHLGGFEGDNAVQTTKSFTFDSELVLDGKNEGEIHMVSNVARLWHGAESLAVQPTLHMPGELAKSMSGNYYDSFVFDHVHN